MVDTSGLPEYAVAMLDPAFYPDKPAAVELLQTQMSFVFVAGAYVYKTKKPVDLGYLDYTTLEKRRYFCERETVLNRRLCPDAYLGVVPISKTGKGIAIGETGETIEYAVKMRSLRRDRMLNVLLANDQATPEMIDRLARRLVDFHQRAETDREIAAFGGISTIRANTNENFDQTERSVGRTISLPKFQRIKHYTRDFLAANRSLLTSRVSTGRIRDCHGDLHAAHVCFEDGICVYDCIEFNDRFRYGDVASEVAFLAMDLDHYGRADLSHRFVSAYAAIAEDPGLLRLLPFYKCYRAYVRGKVESFKLDDAYIPSGLKEDARMAASAYFDLASFYTRTRPSLFITVGVTGTGKSTFAQALSKRIGLAVISSDVVRKRLAGTPLTEHRFDGFQAGLYSREFSRRTYDTMLSQAGDLLASGCSVVLDATFIRKEDRAKARKLADEASASYYLLEFSASEETIRKWLEARSQGPSVSDGRIEILKPQMEQFEAVDEAVGSNHITIDPSLPIGHNIACVLDMLGEN